MTNQTSYINPFIGLLEMQNVITLFADSWDDKIVTAKNAAIEFLNDTDMKVLMVTKDPTASKKLQAQFKGYDNIIFNDVKSNLSAFKDLSNIYAIVVVDSGLINDSTKYLFGIQAASANCRLVFVV
jgi:acetylornithine/succinyldiaminopimelate/putrescine aminotransferase